MYLHGNEVHYFGNIKMNFQLVGWDKGKTFNERIKAWTFEGIFIRGLKKDSGGVPVWATYLT